jgi:hypothetical protein
VVSSAAGHVPAAAAAAPVKGYIVSPLYDGAFFVGAPVIAMASTRALAASGSAWLGVFAIAFTHAHLFLVFFRSHGNPDIFKLHRVRFVVAPVVLFAAIAWSPFTLAFALVLATWWDVYHSAQQTFGLARIYDRLAGNAPDAGRTLDRILNHVIYVGPIVGGASFVAHLDSFDSFRHAGSAFFTQVPMHARAWHGWLALIALAGGAAFLVVYVVSYARLIRQGYRVSIQKVVLLASTAFTCIWLWGLEPGNAFVAVNLFHALQYFALVAHTERNTIPRVLKAANTRWALPAAWLVLVVAGAAYGIWAARASKFDIGGAFEHLPLRLAFAATLTVSLLHFWYDGFIWSVRKKQV